MTAEASSEIIVGEIDKSYEGIATVSIWRWYRTPSGELRPGKGGLVVGLRHLPALAEALASALAIGRQ